MSFSIALVIFTKLHLIGICEAILGGSDGKESACNAGDPGSIPGLGRPSREGNALLCCLNSNTGCLFAFSFLEPNSIKSSYSSFQNRIKLLFLL